MNPKTILLALLAVITPVLHASAQVEIRISGAVAFRDTAYRAIRNLFGQNLASQNPADSPSAPRELKVTWTGKLPSLYGDQDVTVYAFYNGAVAGIQDLTQNRQVAFLASSIPLTTNLLAAPSDLAFSSIFQQATEFTSPTLEDTVFGATPINLVKSSSAPAAITNITSHQFKTLAANGAVPAWFFTGNSNDTQTIHFINRDPTAGQRVTLFKEALFTGNPIQYQWDPSANEFVFDPQGRNATQIATHLNNFGPAISYLISTDSITVNNGLNILAYNGVKAFNGTFSTVANDFSPVANGQYSLWVYEHLLNRTTASANIRAFRNALVTAINVELELSAFSIPASRLRVERTADGAPVAPLE